MSRIFEVLERLQKDQEIFQVPSVTKQPHRNVEPTEPRVSISELDAFARGEVMTLVQRLFLATNGDGRDGLRRVVFCGIDKAEGSNLLCSRVGLILAEQVESQVCLVDANLRAPTPNPLYRLLPSTEPQPEDGTTPKFIRRITKNLCVLSGESATTNGCGGTLSHLKAIITDLTEQFEYWVISAAPIGLYTDAALLAQIAEGLVLVLEANSTRRAAALKAKQSLGDANVRILGAVLNSRAFPIPEAIYRRL